jgi:probable F420-dependent oxidoreductase
MVEQPAAETSAQVGPKTLKRFRFGAGSAPVDSQDKFAASCRHVESLGYDLLTFPDHVESELGPIAAVTAAALATTRIRIGTKVLANDFRHPAILARELATIDILSGGRLDIGIGAGGRKSDFDRTGLPYDTNGIRISRLMESVAIIKGLLANETFSYEGKFYRVEGAIGQPRPVQKPHPPFVIGGGRQRILSFAAREADIVSFNMDLSQGGRGPIASASMSDDKTQEKLNWVREAAGARMDQLELQIQLYGLAIAQDRSAAAAKMGQAWDLPVETILSSPHFLIGELDEVCDELERRRRDLGISMFTVSAGAIDDFAPVVERLSGK